MFRISSCGFSPFSKAPPLQTGGFSSRQRLLGICHPIIPHSLPAASSMATPGNCTSKTVPGPSPGRGRGCGRGADGPGCGPSTIPTRCRASRARIPTPAARSGRKSSAQVRGDATPVVGDPGHRAVVVRQPRLYLDARLWARVFHRVVDEVAKDDVQVHATGPHGARLHVELHRLQRHAIAEADAPAQSAAAVPAGRLPLRRPCGPSPIGPRRATG